MDEKDFSRFLVGMREFNIIEPIGSLYLKNKEESSAKTSGPKVSGPTALKAVGQLALKEESSAKFSGPKISGPTALKAVGPLALVEIISYCLNPNHYHLILKQVADKGISEFIKRIAGGYTWYFNNRHNRSGVLFQGKFKAVHVKSYSYLLKLLVYVNCNYEVHGLGKSKNWIWSSFLDSIGKRNGTLCNLDIIKAEFKTRENFKKFCEEIIPEIKANKNLQKYSLE